MVLGLAVARDDWVVLRYAAPQIKKGSVYGAEC